MKDICIHDIGDGLAAKIITIDNNVIQLDCGSQQYPQKASDSLFSPPPNFFIISHYHKDHYNGLLMNSTRSLSLKEVFLPRLPEFPDKAHFLKCLLAINWLVGDASGVMEADFLNILSKINTCPFSYKMVSQGEQINIGSSKFDVLWPPMKIDDQNTLKCISSAIQDFNIAKEENGSLREVFDKIQNLNSISIYEKVTGELPGRYGEKLKARKESLPPQAFSQEVKNAIESLRRAANHLSLAFHEDNRLLFMGDLGSSEIKAVAETLENFGRNNFIVFMTPHHGTHWDNSLKKIRVKWAVSSVGGGLFKYIRSEKYKEVTEYSLFTYSNGSIRLPPSCPRYCYGFSGHY